LSGNFPRGGRSRDIFDFTAARTGKAKTEKEMKSLVKKKNKVDYFLSKMCVYFVPLKNSF
jgi:hypothetical protein